MLNDRVELLGDIPNHKVRDVLCRGKIFLNTSLIEAFGITILEAASWGLLVVSTNVGGIPEVLPKEMLYLAEPGVDELWEIIDKAIENSADYNGEAVHELIKDIYSWNNVAKETEKVYDDIIDSPSNSLGDVFKQCFSGGPLAGIFNIMITWILIIYSWVMNYIQPEEDIDRAMNFPVKKYTNNPQEFGDHEFIVDNREDSILMKKYKSEEDKS